MNNAQQVHAALPAKKRKTLTIGSSANSNDEAFISAATYNHISLFVSSCQPGQYSEIEIRLDESSLPKLRPLLRDAEWLLEVGGTLTVHTKSEHAQHECYRILSKRFALTITSDKVSGTKLKSKEVPEYGNAKWSICVVSGGNNENKLEKVIQSVAQAELDEVELLIIGPKPKITLPDFARHIDFVESQVDPRFPIVEKKNLCAKLAKFDNLLIIHDRFFLTPSWTQAIKMLRTDWDVLVFPVEISDRPELSLQDWCAYSNPIAKNRGSDRLFRYFETYPFNYENLRHHSLDSNEYDDGVMSCGGSFAVRRQVLLDTPIDQRLRWAEIEDGDWSERLIAAGYIISLAPTAQLGTRSDWKSGTKRWSNLKLQRSYLNLRADFRRLVFKSAQFIIDKLARREDLFAKQGCFSKKIKRVSVTDLSALRTLKWESLEGIYVQGDFETRPNIRDLLAEIYAHVPTGKSVTLELSSAGFPYLFRSEHIRNCESLCYEASLVFRDDFYVRQLICTKQRNFIVEYVRTKKSSVPLIKSLFVYRLGKSTFPASLPAFASEITTLEELANKPDLEQSAVLFIGDSGADSIEELINTYKDYGAAWCGTKPDLFGGTLLAPAATIKSSLKHPTIKGGEKFLIASLEKQLILEGFWPKVCTSAHHDKK